MNIAQLNKLIETVNSPKLSQFDSKGISSTLLPEGDYLYMSLRERSVMLYMRCETLGEESADNPNLFESLLSLNVFGGRYNNIRLTYDRDTTVLWLCYDISLDPITPESFQASLKLFIDAANSFRNFLNSKILDVVLGSNQTPVAQSAADMIKDSSAQFSPDQTYQATDRPSAPDNNADSEIFQQSNAMLETEENGMINVMVAQSMFMLA